MTLDNEVKIYDHILGLVNQAEDLGELKVWITRERNDLIKIIEKITMNF